VQGGCSYTICLPDPLPSYDPLRYECKETDGSFMAAFPDCCRALEWAVTLQLALMELNWPQELQRIELSADAFDPETSQVGLEGGRHHDAFS